MKLIIDVSVEEFETLSKMSEKEKVNELSYYEMVIANGKPYEERQQGEWINHRDDNGHNIADCSFCGKTMQWHDEDEDGIPRYCWYCGAQMLKGGAKE